MKLYKITFYNEAIGINILHTTASTEKDALEHFKKCYPEWKFINIKEEQESVKT